MLFLLIFLLILTVFVIFQHQKYSHANRLYKQAKELESKSITNTNDLNKLKEALAIYRQCQRINNNAKYTKAVNNCQIKIDNRRRYQSSIEIGKKKVKENYFKAALSNFKKAEQLFATDKVKAEIEECYRGIERENKYEQNLLQINQIARQGKFQTAIDLLTPKIASFPRQDGEQLLKKLKTVIRGKELYQLGLIAEQGGDMNRARSLYQQALELIPQYIDCKYRLAIITVKNSPRQTINYLKEIKSEQAAYIRGFAYTQLGKWQQAEREWKEIDRPKVEVQRNIINDLSTREGLTVKHKIERAIDNSNLEKAKLISINHLAKHERDLIIKNNLANYIQPLLENEVWQNKDWHKIAAVTKQNWLERQDIKSLHNWAVATYYLAQIDSNKRQEFIIARSTALANIELDPIFKNIPWLGSNCIDLKDVAHKLKQIAENAIELIKDDVEQYLKLRDIYRRDMVMLALAKQNDCGVRTRSQLLILPNCYEQFNNSFSHPKLPNSIWGALYTDWGTAVAACYEKDIARAIAIKPKQDPASEVEHFAYCFVSYHEGCHYLESQYWRKAIKHLQAAKPEITTNLNWCNKIDRLCQMNCREITKFDERLEFGKFWYLLVGSQPAKTYYVEHQSMQIGMDVDSKKISFQQAINKLVQLQKIDPDNSVNLNIIKTLKVNLDLEKINHLWQKSEYEAAVELAKRSPYEKVRFAVAEVCLQIVLEILQSGNLTIESIQSLQKITQWAYELCPHEPLFQSTYSQLQELGIHQEKQ